MPIKFNGTTVDAVKFNGTTLDKVIFNGVTVFESMTQLATPQNVSADGTVVSWDEVENATSYEVLADGTSIGTVTPSTGETWVFNTGVIEVDNENYSEEYAVAYKSNGNTYTALKVTGSNAPTSGGWQAWIYYDATLVYSEGFSGGWLTDAYRTIVLDSPATGDLLTWLEANAVKQ